MLDLIQCLINNDVQQSLFISHCIKSNIYEVYLDVVHRYLLVIVLNLTYISYV
jgi:hypothetical protein